MRNLQSITSKLSRALIQSGGTSTTSRIITKPQQSIRTISQSQMLAEQMKIQVPTMGDSITEGTIVEWTVQVGQAVKVDDVIAMIETDKVTVDIKAQVDGVLVEQFAKVDDEVEVGADLYMIDTKGVASAAATDDIAAEGFANITVDDAASSSDEQAAAAAVADEPSNTGVRVPSIKFLGKDGWKERLSVAGSATTPQPTAPLKPHGSVILAGGALPSSYGRLPISDREIEDCVLGGAAEAPY